MSLAGGTRVKPLRGVPVIRSACGIGLALGIAFAAMASESASSADDPPLCRAALEARPDSAPLAALADAESKAVRRAKAHRREGKKRMKSTLGSGRQARGQLPAFDALARKEAEAMAEARTLCFCRERRDDPHRSNCDTLYPVRIR